MTTHAVLLLALAACNGPGEPDPAKTGDLGVQPTPEPTSDPTTEIPDPTETRPQALEVPCNGVDDDGDGRPAADATCAPAPDIMVRSTGQNWPYIRIIRDIDGDGLDDVLVVSDSGPRVAQLLNGLTGDQVAEVKVWGPFGMAEPGTTGEFDGAPGLDLWLGEELYFDPVGTDSKSDANRTDAARSLHGVADFDGDGIDEVVAHGGGLGGALPDWSIGAGPFLGPSSAAFTPFAPGAETVSAMGDLDGDGLPDVMITWPDGATDLAHADGAVFATLDPPMVPRPGGDFDGDGVADLIVGWTVFVEAERDCDHWQLAGPFSGAVPFDDATWLTNTTICEELSTFADFDLDGRTDYHTIGDDTWTAYVGGRMPAANDDIVRAAAFSTPIETQDGYAGDVSWGEIDGLPGVDVLVDNYDADGAIYLNIGF